jgi:hypothetical protein
VKALGYKIGKLVREHVAWALAEQAAKQGKS